MKLLLIIIITAALTSAITAFLLPKPQQIFVADFEEIKKSIIMGAVIESATDKRNYTQIAKKKLSKFRSQVSKIAKEKNAIIISKDTVLGNYQDITLDLELLVSDLD